MRLTRAGEKNAFYGKHHSPETIQKISKENHYLWKGNDVGYKPLHHYVKKYLPKPELCEYCKQRPPYDLANITGVYNREFQNWKYLCRSCHMKSDGRMNNLIQFKSKMGDENEQ